MIGQKLPEIKKDSFVVGLLINSERLIEIRKNRISNLDNRENSSYIDYELVNQEIMEAKKLYQKNKWPIIDVTRKSVEETAATIIKLYEQKKEI